MRARKAGAGAQAKLRGRGGTFALPLTAALRTCTRRARSGGQLRVRMGEHLGLASAGERSAAQWEPSISDITVAGGGRGGGGGGEGGGAGAHVFRCRWFGFGFAFATVKPDLAANFGPRAHLPVPHKGVSYRPTLGHRPDISRSTRVGAKSQQEKSFWQFTPPTKRQNMCARVFHPPHDVSEAQQRHGGRLAPPGCACRLSQQALFSFSGRGVACGVAVLGRAPECGSRVTAPLMGATEGRPRLKKERKHTARALPTNSL